MELDFECVLNRDTGLIIEDLPIRRDGLYEKFLLKNETINYQDLIKEIAKGGDINGTR